MQLNHIRANGNLMRAGSRPTPTGNWLQYPRNVFYDDWFPRAETVAEEIALQTLHEMKIRRNVKPRVEGVRESIINNCATASGLTRDQTLALFRKIAWLTMWDRMEMMVDQMADYKERTEKFA